MMFGWLISFYYYLHFVCTMLEDDNSPYTTTSIVISGAVYTYIYDVAMVILIIEQPILFYREPYTYYVWMVNLLLLLPPFCMCNVGR